MLLLDLLLNLFLFAFELTLELKVEFGHGFFFGLLRDVELLTGEVLKELEFCELVVGVIGTDVVL